MKGWVYVITNLAMPGLVKVGYSLKDPTIRAQDLDSTATPHPFEVEYACLVEDPYSLEKQAHSLLKKFHEKKEWFRCSTEDAVLAVKSCANHAILYENCTKEATERAEQLKDKQRIAQEQDELIRALANSYRVYKETVLGRINIIEAKAKETKKYLYCIRVITFSWPIFIFPSLVLLICTVVKENIVIEERIKNLLGPVFSIGALASFFLPLLRGREICYKKDAQIEELLREKDKIVTSFKNYAKYTRPGVTKCPKCQALKISNYLEPFRKEVIKCSECPNTYYLESSLLK